MWVSVDPLAHRGQQYSPFVFSFDSPINFTDPNGKWPILPIIKLTGYLMEKYGDRNTVKEIGYGLNHPINALTVGTADFPNWAITRIASNFEINLKNQAGMRSGSEGDEGNAFRHTLWQAMITKEFNASEAGG